MAGMIRKQKAKVNSHAPDRRASMPPVRTPGSSPRLRIGRRSTSSASARTASTSFAVVNGFPPATPSTGIARFARLPGGQVASRWCAARGSDGARDTSADSATTSLAEFGHASLEAKASTSGRVDGRQARDAHRDRSGRRRTGDRTVLWDRDPALAIRPRRRPGRRRGPARACCSWTATTSRPRPRARESRARHGVLTVIDVEAVLPGVAALLRLIDVIIASEGFPQRR